MKKIKMVIYGEPGVGKSVFALHSPKPFFITTDGNYEWLDEFGAKEKDHIQVSSWKESKEVFKGDFEGYETIVVDLLEDMFKWCEYEFCKTSKIDHISDIGYGKGYDITRNEFFIEISKLLAKDKNIILIMHGIDKIVKDRRGVEHTCYIPSPRIPDKVIDMIEGRVRYFLRCYLKAEESENGVILKKRYLSVVPKENEFGIIRGVNENEIPHDIPLDFNEFAKVIGLDKVETPLTKKAIEETKSFKKAVEKISEKVVIQEVKEEPIKETEITENKEGNLKVMIEEPIEEPVQEVKEEVKIEEPKKEEVPEVKPQRPLTAEEKKQQILAKLNALKNK